MIKITASRYAAAAIVVSGLIFVTSLHDSELDRLSDSDPQPASPHFTIEWQQGRLNLSGDIESAGHAQALMQVAKLAFDSAPVETSFQPISVVPVFWQDMTVQALYLLAETHSSRGDIAVNSITVRGIVVEEFAWQSRLNAVTQMLPGSVSITADTLIIDTAIKVSDICNRTFSTLDPGPINFIESSTKLRSSAYPRLDRIVAVATVCAESNIRITGHTDASGSEAANQRLSLSRANAVAGYMERSGITPERLIVRGRGSEMPLADNQSRYNRSLNRRIEIEFQDINRQDLVR